MLGHRTQGLALFLPARLLASSLARPGDSASVRIKMHGFMKWSSVIFAVGRTSHVDIVATVYTCTHSLAHTYAPTQWQLVVYVLLSFLQTLLFSIGESRARVPRVESREFLVRTSPWSRIKYGLKVSWHELAISRWLRAKIVHWCEIIKHLCR